MTPNSSMFLLFIIVASVLKVKAQDPVQNILDEYYTMESEDNNIADALYYYLDHPLNLNKASEEELQSIAILSYFQIKNLILHRKRYGKLLSLYELQAVPGFDQVTIRNILPFVTVVPPMKKLKLFSKGSSYIMSRVDLFPETRKGFQDSSFKGGQQRYRLRFRSSSPGSYSLGINFENDPGEDFIFAPEKGSYGFDHTSFHIAVFNKRFIKKAILGDYQLQFGQGLTFGAGFFPGKGSQTVSGTLRPGPGLRQYTSFMEGNQLRGAAVTAGSDRIQVTGFGSYKHADVKHEEGSLVEYSVADLHRTEAEIQRKGTARKASFGGNINWEVRNNLSIGYNHSTSRLISPKDKTPWSQNASLYYSYITGNIYFFGEAGINKSLAPGFITGFTGAFSSMIDLSMIFRHYDPEYSSSYGNSFGENTRPENETGIYWGIKIIPNEQFFISGYYDRFWFPAPRYRVNSPSQGHEYLIRISYSPEKYFNAFVQYKSETKEENGTDAVIKPLYERKKQNLTFNMKLSGNPFSYLMRLQISEAAVYQDRSRGYSLFQDLILSLGKVVLTGRYGIFDTGSYENRHYAYERDLLYAFSLPPYYGRGTRVYLLLKTRVLRNLTFRIKYGRTRYYDREVIGSGRDQINKPHKSEIKMQVMYRF